MARSLSSTLKAAANAQQTAEAIVTLITIDHADLGSPIRYCDADADVTSGARVFTAAAFRIILPADSDGAPPRVTLEVDAVDRAIIDTALSLSSPPTLDVEYVLASAPSTIEIGPITYLIDDVAYDSTSLKATLAFEPVLNEPIPADRFTPITFPGMFK